MRLDYYTYISFTATIEVEDADDRPDERSLEKNLEATVETWAQENDISIDEIGISVGTTVTELQ
ncbi:hypothetical protein ES708_08583 [subsurface metagenome]